MASKYDFARDVHSYVKIFLNDRLSESRWDGRVRIRRMDEFMTRSVNNVIVAACNQAMSSGRSVHDGFDIDIINTYLRGLTQTTLDDHFHDAWKEMCVPERWEGGRV